jgi:uncharacterized lipoprotein YbaY
VLEYDRAAIDPAHHYGLRATISDADGRVLRANLTTHPVFREGTPEAATIWVQRAPSSPGP